MIQTATAWPLWGSGTPPEPTPWRETSGEYQNLARAAGAARPPKTLLFLENGMKINGFEAPAASGQSGRRGQASRSTGFSMKIDLKMNDFEAPAASGQSGRRGEQSFTKSYVKKKLQNDLQRKATGSTRVHKAQRAHQ